MTDLTLAEEYARLNEATRKAHEAIADMRTERRLLAEERAKITGTVEDLMQEAVDPGHGRDGQAGPPSPSRPVIDSPGGFLALLALGILAAVIYFPWNRR